MSKTEDFPLPTLGVDMLSSETALPAGTVRSAANVDIGREGRFARREGYVRRVDSPNMHSIYYAPQRGMTVVGRSSELLTLNPVDFSTVLLHPLDSDHPIDYAEYNGNLYFCNRSTLGWLPSNSTVARRVGVPTPAAPTLDANTAGAMLPGAYGVVITAVDDRGEESGACEFQTIDLPEGGGIRLSNLPQQLGYTVFAYVTSADGEVLQLMASFPAVFPTYLLGDASATGTGCDTQYLVPLPSGDFVAWHNGRLFTAGGGAVRFSEAMRPHLHNPAHGIIPFSGHIALLKSVGDGIYVGDSRGVWFLDGRDPVKFQPRLVSAARAVPGSAALVEARNFPDKMVPVDSPVALWLSTSGYIVGMPGGTTVELQSDRIKVPSGLAGRSAFLLRDGRKQVVTPVNSTATASFGTAVDSVIP